MTHPSVTALRFLTACSYGVELGLFYSFLRPVRCRWVTVSDLMFTGFTFWQWLRLSFAVCQGDIRLGITLGLAAGCVCWELTAGRVLQHVFHRFWSGVWRLLGLICHPFKKIIEKIYGFLKKIFASAKKWGTIKWSSRRQKAVIVGGKPHGHLFGKSEKGKAGSPSQQHTDEGRSAVRCAVFYGSASVTERFTDRNAGPDSGTGDSGSRAGAGAAESSRTHRKSRHR
jgi:hypothetical protein